ncbi:hypothetical protein KDL01_32635 [Actinospica durhamensis]|uniref:Uncharacterized protein n=1 Tax=Actinospica durhamensis TaxID=1508375 RepID=A0A941EVK2_9ACTN|nr:hypothetical protein [Actinospica durhamensis]MBR7838066.1 hypothetical protein [Actinospica durhamensis]
MMLIGDSAYPPSTYPTEYDGRPVVGWCVYIPGGDAYHGWTQAEIDALKAQPWCRYILPVFVRSSPQGTAQASADAATVAAWARAQGQPRGTLTMLDYETAVDSAYELAFDRDLRNADGDLELLYGSKSTVVQNTAPSGGYDEADWTGAVPTSVASTGTQFYSGSDYDLNDLRDTAPLWDIRPPARSATPQEDDMTTTSVNGRAGLSWPAGSRHVVQVTYDPAAGDPTLRVVLALTTGPVVLALKPANGSGDLEIPAQYVPTCRGVIFESASGSPNVVYDACAV